MSKYTYLPLDKPGSKFRLLQITKDPRTHRPQCSLQKYSLINCPVYTALSYTWGETTPIHSIAVNGAYLEVRQNLFDFLNAYTTEAWGMDNTTRPVFYWIDQICINQEDPLERSDQVGIMDKIFKQAKMVFIWLGCDANMIEAARRRRDKEDDDASALDTIIANQYFSRTWIIQEIALSLNSPLIVCGGIELDWDCVRPARKFPLSFHAPATAPIYVRDQLPKRGTLQLYILYHYRSDCHDPRDKVYGLLGLTPGRWRVHVDYTKEVLEVYFDTVAALCEELFDLKDPECLYPGDLTNMTSPLIYCNTLVSLGLAMGFSQQHLRGLRTFLRFCLDVYMDTKIRNVQYTYTGRIYTRVPTISSSEPTLAQEEKEEIEVSWGSMTGTRRNPLLRDIIPEMGLQLASTTAESADGQSGNSVLVRDRWWCKHDGEIHYFDCPDEKSMSPYP